MQFFQYADTFSYYHLPTLALPLLKLESQACGRKPRPNVLDEELGGWQNLDLIAWCLPAVLANQPKWQISWVCKHLDNITPYAKAPRNFQISPIF